MRARSDTSPAGTGAGGDGAAGVGRRGVVAYETHSRADWAEAKRKAWKSAGERERWARTLRAS
jgi:hypothetical protein